MNLYTVNVHFLRRNKHKDPPLNINITGAKLYKLATNSPKHINCHEIMLGKEQL